MGTGAPPMLNFARGIGTGAPPIPATARRMLALANTTSSASKKVTTKFFMRFPPVDDSRFEYLQLRGKRKELFSGSQYFPYTLPDLTFCQNENQSQA
jgi:hypothetical protein